MLIDPALPVVETPDLLWRTTLSGEPWAFLPDEPIEAIRAGYATRDIALLQLLVRAPRFRLPQVDMNELRELALAGAPIDNVIAGRGGRIHQRVTAVALQAVHPAGPFFDLRNPQDVEDFRFDLSMDPDFHQALKYDFSTGTEITGLLRKILSFAEVGGRRCGGYLDLDADGIETWEVFSAGAGDQLPVEMLGNDGESYAELGRLASSLGVSMPLSPSDKIARLLMAEALTPGQLADLTSNIGGFEIDDVELDK
jgi:hypothetical protein